jgi:hypothetical protein
MKYYDLSLLSVPDAYYKYTYVSNTIALFNLIIFKKLQKLCCKKAEKKKSHETC